jgi:hypothetical protein
VLRMFEIIAKSKMVYNSSILEQIISLVSANLKQFSAEQLIRILFYYSKSKYKDV